MPLITEWTFTAEVASQLDEILRDRPELLFPPGARYQEIELPAGRARIIKGHLFQPDGVQVGQATLELSDPARSLFVKALADAGVSEKVIVPLDGDPCRDALAKYSSYTERVTDEFTRLASALTADENMQDRVVKELWKRVKR